MYQYGSPLLKGWGHLRILVASLSFLQLRSSSGRDQKLLPTLLVVVLNFLFISASQGSPGRHPFDLLPLHQLLFFSLVSFEEER